MPSPSLFLLPSSPSLLSLFIKEIIQNNGMEEWTKYKVSAKTLFSSIEIKGRGTHLSFIYQVKSDSAKAMIERLSIEVGVGAGLTYAPTSSFKAALSGLIANLLIIAGDDDLDYGYHGMSPGAFKGLNVGYKPFKAVVAGLYEFRHIEKERGFKEHAGPCAKAQATRFKATNKLLDYVAEFGITPANWPIHFEFVGRPAAIRNPVLLKTTRTFAREPSLISIDLREPAVAAIAKQVNELNAFFAKQVIEPNCHYGFVRMFANGDRPDFAWDQGGRLYSIGYGNYQQLPGAPHKEYPFCRRDIRINGEPTVELDIKASHLTILHACAGIPLANGPDPYVIPGIPRAVVKAFVTMTLGYDRFHRDWTDNAVATYRKKSKSAESPGGLDLLKYDLSTVRDRVLAAIPILRSWPEGVIRWGDLQYIESVALIETVHSLAMDHDIPALPVHDSIIVGQPGIGVAKEVLSEHYKRSVSSNPLIDIK
jgi:hypothetical protein